MLEREESPATPVSEVVTGTPTPSVAGVLEDFKEEVAAAAADAVANEVAALALAATPTAIATATPTVPIQFLPESGGVLAILPIASTPTLTPTTLPTVEARAEWPSQMDINNSGLVEVSLKIVDATATSSALTPSPTLSSPTPTATLSGVQKIWEEIRTFFLGEPAASDTADKDINLNMECGIIPDGYEGLIVANLDGAAFDINPSGAQPETIAKLKRQEDITWRWIIAPEKSGSHKLSLNIDIEFRSINGDGQRIQCDIWERVLDISVKKHFFTVGQLTVTTFVTGFLGLGSEFNLPWLIETVTNPTGQKRRKGKEKEKE